MKNNLSESAGELGTGLIKLGIGIAVLAVAVPFAVDQVGGLVAGVIDTPSI